MHRINPIVILLAGMGIGSLATLMIMVLGSYVFKSDRIESRIRQNHTASHDRADAAVEMPSSADTNIADTERAPLPAPTGAPISGFTEILGQHGWTLANYNEPQIVDGADHLRISGDGPPAGQFFKSGLDPSICYRLSLSGRRLDQPVNLRVRRDAATPEYFSAPDQTFSLIITETSHLEVLIYADTAFQYDLTRLDLKPETVCTSAHDLRSLLIASIDGLDAALALNDTVKIADLLLGWTAHTADQGFDPETVIRNTSLFADLPVEQIYYDMLLPNNGGTYCGGMAVFMDKILSLFDIPAFTADFGFADSNMTHVTAVIPIRRDGTYLFYIMDPTFYGNYHDVETDHLLDLDTVLTRYSRGEHASYEFRHRPPSRSISIPIDRVAAYQSRFAKWGIDVDCGNIAMLESETQISCDGFDHPYRYFINSTSDIIKKLDIDRDRDVLIQLMMNRVYSTSFHDDGEARLAFDSLLDRHSIPWDRPDVPQ